MNAAGAMPAIVADSQNTHEATPHGAGRGRETVTRAIQQASVETGVDFAYLMEKAAAESSFDPDARAPTSSATGLFQFIESTWLDVVKRYGDRHGLGHLAERIETGSGGRPQVGDPALRAEILDLRRDPTLASVMAGELARENQAYIERSTGAAAGPTDLYMAHFLGAGDAARFLNAMSEDGGRPAADLFPRAAAANRHVFYDRSGSALSLDEVHARFNVRFEGAEAKYAESAPSVGTGGQREAQPVQVPGRSSPMTLKEPADLAGQSQTLFTVMMLASLDNPLDREDVDRAGVRSNEAVSDTAARWGEAAGLDL